MKYYEVDEISNEEGLEMLKRHEEKVRRNKLTEEQRYIEDSERDEEDVKKGLFIIAFIILCAGIYFLDYGFFESIKWILIGGSILSMGVLIMMIVSQSKRK